jgi:hypothetical protein
LSEIDKSSKDTWEEKLEIELNKLAECQKSKGYDSCMKCEKMFGCEIRELYVKAVYESMNKGRSGGFEF